MCEILSQFTTEELQKFAAAHNAEELLKLAKELGHPIGSEEAESVFAVLYPLRGKIPLNEEDLVIISGGGPKPSKTALPRKKPSSTRL